MSWYAGQRRYDRAHRPRHHTVRIVGQPRDGFETIAEVMDWLAERALIARHEDPEEGTFWTGWGDPYCAVDGSRGDPWGAAS